MDLNGWTGKTYTNPPFVVALKVALGARKLRCEYCRLNFASFRRRKEAFTFKRWKKFGKQAEERSAPAISSEPTAQAQGEPDKSKPLPLVTAR
jgi:MoaA/NifB/PqqE/SkfB family radical SAM enzyme